MLYFSSYICGLLRSWGEEGVSLKRPQYETKRHTRCAILSGLTICKMLPLYWPNNKSYENERESILASRRQRYILTDKQSSVWRSDANRVWRNYLALVTLRLSLLLSGTLGLCRASRVIVWGHSNRHFVIILVWYNCTVQQQQQQQQLGQLQYEAGRIVVGLTTSV